MAQTPTGEGGKSPELSSSMATGPQSADSAKQSQKARKAYSKLKAKPQVFPSPMERPGFLSPERSQRFIFRDAGPMYPSPDSWGPNFHLDHEPYPPPGYQPGFRSLDMPTDFRSDGYPPRRELFASDDYNGWRGSRGGAYAGDDLDYVNQSHGIHYDDSFMDHEPYRRQQGPMHARRYSDHPFHGFDEGFSEMCGPYDVHRRTDRYLESAFFREQRLRPRMPIEQLSQAFGRQSLEDRSCRQMHPLDGHGLGSDQDFPGNFKSPRHCQDYQISPRSVHEFDAVGDRSPSPGQGSLENGVWIPFQSRDMQHSRVMHPKSMAAADVLPSQDEMDMHLSTVQYVR